MQAFLLFVVLVSVTHTECWLRVPNSESSKLVDAKNSDVDPGQPLNLTKLIEENKLAEAKQASKVNHPDFQGIESYSGFITVNKTCDSNLFFWFFPSQGDQDKDPVVIWLNGGPGSSSLYGLFIENGPFVFTAKDTLALREYSWTKSHSVLFIDNPAGSGFSFTKNNGWATTETQIGEELFEFLQQFYTIFSEYQKNDLYITGESYAGKYVPAIGYTILKKNPGAKVKMNLKGLAIGNGYTDPIHQFEYSDLMYNMGLIDEASKDFFKEKESGIREEIINGNWTPAFILNMFFHIQVKFRYDMKSSLYNYLTPTKPPTGATDFLLEYLERKDVRAAIHVGNLQFDLNSTEVYDAMKPDHLQSVAPWVIELLDNYPVLVYSGQLDLAVAYTQTVNYLEHLAFNGADQYKTASRRLWYVDDELAGYVKTGGKLTEVLVRNAGHLVPFDQPKWAYDLIYKFIRNIPLSK